MAAGKKIFFVSFRFIVQCDMLEFYLFGATMVEQQSILQTLKQRMLLAQLHW